MNRQERRASKAIKAKPSKENSQPLRNYASPRKAKILRSGRGRGKVN